MPEHADKNRFTLDYRDNPELQSALMNKQPGERCTIEIELTVTANDTERFEGAVESITPDDYEGEDGQDEIEPGPDDPVLLAIAAPDPAARETEEEDEATG